MDPGDIIPLEEISQFFALPPWIVFIGIFILGYVLFKIIVKKKVIERKKIDTIDQIILITIIGSVWFFRIILFIAWFWNSLNQYHIIPTLIMIFLGIFSIFIIIQDFIWPQQPKIKVIEGIKKKKYYFFIGYTYVLIILITILLDTTMSDLYNKSYLILILFFIMCYSPLNTLIIKGYIKIS